MTGTGPENVAGNPVNNGYVARVTRGGWLRRGGDRAGAGTGGGGSRGAGGEAVRAADGCALSANSGVHARPALKLAAWRTVAVSAATWRPTTSSTGAAIPRP